jgi:hypothetical protein
MVDEPPPPRTVSGVVGGAFSVMGVGALMFLNGAGELVFNRPGTVRR